jgi:phosphoribosylformylglycinamidine cyclo-ligase
MQTLGNVAENEMYRTFNMGVGMVIIAAPDDAKTLQSTLQQNGDAVFEIGHVINGQQEVLIQ